MQHFIRAPRQTLLQWALALQDIAKATKVTKPTAAKTIAKVAEEVLAVLKPGYVPLVPKRVYVVYTTNYDDTECRTLEDALAIIAARYRLSRHNGTPPKLNSLRTMMANSIVAGGNKNKQWTKNIWDENGILLVLSVTMRKKLLPA